MTRHEDNLAKRLKDPAFKAAYDKEYTGLTQIKQPNGLTVWVKESIDKAGVATPKQKIAIEKADAELTLKVEERDPTCWYHGCYRSALIWVREIQFDIKTEKVAHDQAIINTNDYGGPVPGFCRWHDLVGPKQLAEAVYVSREEFKWGAPANRWFVIFTDGTKTGGGVEALDIPKGNWAVKEDFAPGDSH